MLYVDLKYITTVGIHLRNFKRKQENLFNCSCPVCGDSESKKTKARGYFYRKGSSMYYKCHNCSCGIGIANFLKSYFPSYHPQYILEKYKSGVEKRPDPVEKIPSTRIVFSKFDTNKARRISELEPSHYARAYIVARKIPTQFLSRIYYTDDFSLLVDDVFPGKYQNLPKSDPRLIIPFFDRDGGLIGLQGRSFTPERSLRYITIRSSAATDLIYGLDRVDSNKQVFVVEGPIDSLFLPNCLAAANSDLCSVIDKTALSDVVLVYDNEPRNKEIVRLMADAIRKNKKICIWPPNTEEKDINDMIMAGKNPDEILLDIQQHTFTGLRAQLEFSTWKKI